MATPTTDQTPTKNPSAVSPAPIDASETEQSLTASEAIKTTAVLAQSYTVDDCKSAAQSYRRSNLRSALKAMLAPQ
jgi:cell envelope opacity-associated protein A